MTQKEKEKLNIKFILSKYPKRFTRAKRKKLRARDLPRIAVFNQVFNDPYMTTEYSKDLKKCIYRGAGKAIEAKFPEELNNDK